MAATITSRRRPKAPLKLVRFSVRKLFGLFDHNIPLSQDEHVTIIHAKNGYGKTVVLKLIAALFSELPSTRSLRAAFSRYEFELITFELNDGRTLRISQQRRTPVSDVDKRTTGRVRLNFELRRGKRRERGPWSPHSISKSRANFPLSYVEQRIPELTRIGFEEWLLRSESIVLDLDDVIERYGTRVSFLQRIAEIEQPLWLVELRTGIACTLIETQRLISQQSHERRVTTSEVRIVSRVQEFAAGLARIMSDEVQKYATLSQSLDQTFPRRFLRRGDQDAMPGPQLIDALAAFETLRRRLSDAGLLKQSDDDTVLPGPGLKDSDRELLTLYAQDTGRKLGIFDDILAKIELFTRMINKRFEFKTLKTSLEKGFYFEDLQGRQLQLSDLSSGEQHELVLFYDLLFRAKPNSLILLDEPEISLHIGWQRQFIPDLQQVLKLTPIDVLISTHSPHLAAGKLGLMVRLEGPNK